MKEIQYKTFSWKIHKKNWQIKRPNVCQFELTFRCGLYCKHCYLGCYSKPSYLKRELTTAQVKFLLDKLHQAGVIWICFTGGDPLTREDFLEVYSYARGKGFIISIFTNGYSMTKGIANYLKNRPPFVIEITLNGVTKEIYEKISQVKGSFEKMLAGLEMITQRKLPLEIKTQVMKDNLEELPKIREFVENRGLKFRVSSDLYSRLNGDSTPCSLRIAPDEVLSLDKRLNVDLMNQEDERTSSIEYPVSEEAKGQNYLQNEYEETNTNLFCCAVGGGDGINLDPFGNMFFCNLIRQPSFNLLELSIEEAMNRLLPLARGRKFTTDSKCKYCRIRDFCHSCPGRALLEAGDMEAPVEYYCKLAEATSEQTQATSNR